MLFPYGFILEGLPRNFPNPEDRFTYGDIWLAQGQLFKLEANAQFPKKISFGGDKTRSRGETFLPDRVSPLTEDLFQLTLDINFLGYDEEHKLHKIRPEVSEFSIITNSAALPTYRLPLPNALPTEKLAIFASNDPAGKTILDTLFFREDERITFRIRHRHYDKPFPNGQLNDNSWTVLSRFSSTVYGPDFDNLYVVGNYKILINKVTVHSGTPATDRNKDLEEYWGYIFCQSYRHKFCFSDPWPINFHASACLHVPNRAVLHAYSF